MRGWKPLNLSRIYRPATPSYKAERQASIGMRRRASAAALCDILCFCLAVSSWPTTKLYLTLNYTFVRSWQSLREPFWGFETNDKRSWWWWWWWWWRRWCGDGVGARQGESAEAHFRVVAQQKENGKLFNVIMVTTKIFNVMGRLNHTCVVPHCATKAASWWRNDGRQYDPTTHLYKVEWMWMVLVLVFLVPGCVIVTLNDDHETSREMSHITGSLHGKLCKTICKFRAFFIAPFTSLTFNYLIPARRWACSSTPTLLTPHPPPPGLRAAVVPLTARVLLSPVTTVPEVGVSPL